jgi:hypothetical protein
MGKPLAFFFQASQAACNPLFLLIVSSSEGMPAMSPPGLWPLLPASDEDHCDYTGNARVTQDDLPAQMLDSIPSAKPLFQGK